LCHENWTDGVLLVLGPNRKPVQHFDIGTGSGHSLMLAQRSNADKLTHWKLIKLHTNKLSIILKTD
jgi:hypothetical protein